MRLFYFFLLLWVTTVAYTQDLSYSIIGIPEDLLESANSVLRYEKHSVKIPDQSTINIKQRRVVAVLNKRGDRDVETYLYYDDVSRIKSVTATFYDALGNEIKKYKQRDFKDVSAVDGISLYTDSRVIYIDHTPNSYPYTVVLESETTSKNTVAIPTFYANEGYYSSTQEKYLEIDYSPELGLKYKTHGNADHIVIKEASGKLYISVKESPAIIPEVYSPGYRNIVGRVEIALNNFHLQGVNGDAQDWKIFGQWMNDNLLTETRELPQETITVAQELVKNMSDPIEKAKAIYEYVQGKTRYISVQVGIGGWKPMLASQVDKLGYGDCKALTNYTKALLEVVGVESYYTVLYGSNEKRNIETDFATIQGNHVILSLPKDDDYIWLECTDQNVPFGFIAGFTDDRDVLVVKPEGGEVVHTKKYTSSDNYQTMKGKYQISKEGDIAGTVEIKSGGLQYGDRFRIEKDSDDNQKKHYYKFWNYINNLSFSEISLDNNKLDVVMTERVSLEAENYAAFAGNEMLVPINLFNRYTSLPDRVKNRQLAVNISRGFIDKEDIEIKIPGGFEIIAIPEDQEIKTVFGRYATVVKKLDRETLSYSRVFEFFEGTYDKEEYNAFRSFIKNVIRNDQQKLVIKKKKI